MQKFSKNLLMVNDTVIIISGADKNKTGRLMSFDRKRGLVKVEGMNMKYHATKEQGRVKREGWMDCSKVMFYLQDKHIYSRLTKDKEGNRIVKKTGTIITSNNKEVNNG